MHDAVPLLTVCMCSFVRLLVFTGPCFVLDSLHGVLHVNIHILMHDSRRTNATGSSLGGLPSTVQ